MAEITGYMSLEEAFEKYGIENVFVSASDCQCPSCARIFLEIIERRAAHKLTLAS